MAVEFAKYNHLTSAVKAHAVLAEDKEYEKQFYLRKCTFPSLIIFLVVEDIVFGVDVAQVELNRGLKKVQAKIYEYAKLFTDVLSKMQLAWDGK